MPQDVMKMKFTDDVVFNDKANNGFGEHQARFVIVHPGEEEKGESLISAFKSNAARNLHERGSIVTLSQKQMEFRIAQLKSLPAHAETVNELQRGVSEVKKTVAASKNEIAATGQKQTMQVRKL